MPTWNNTFAATPGVNDAIGEGDDRIRELKTAVYERLVKELTMNINSGLPAEDGWLRSGASKIYYGSSTPTTRPDGVTSLTSADYGRVWYNTSDAQLYVYGASGWVVLTPANAAYATSAGSAASATHATSATYATTTGDVPTLAPHAIVRLTSGSGNWTVPTGVTRIKVRGGGGGGGGGCGIAGQYYNGGCGGAGIFPDDTSAVIQSVTPGASLPYSVGVGGAKAPLGGAASSGGNTTFNGITFPGCSGGANGNTQIDKSPGNAAPGESATFTNSGLSKGGNGGGPQGGHSPNTLPGFCSGGCGGNAAAASANTGQDGGSGIVIIEY